MTRRLDARGPEGLFGHRFATPVGELLSLVDARGALKWLAFGGEASLPGRERWTPDAARNAAVERQLGEYFQRRRRDFDLELDPEGTRFQRRVWMELRKIPYGATVTYGELSTRLGDPRAVRAVGRANATNPIAIVIPCHRVIGADGGLVGYGGGLDVKRALLELEGAAPRATDQGRLF